MAKEDSFMEFDESQFDPGNITETELSKEIRRDFLDYSMSVIVARALPDVRDGLKPVQRRILFSMNEMNNGPDKPYKKCARIVGDTMGKYHPSSVLAWRIPGTEEPGRLLSMGSHRVGHD